MISAVVLAADRPERPGSSRFLDMVRGKPVLQSVLENAVRSNVDEVVCVVRNLAEIRTVVRVRNEKLSWLIDYGADSGKSHSLIAGLWAINPLSAGVLFLAGDQVGVSEHLLDALVDRFNSGSSAIVVPTVRPDSRCPILFGRELFSELVKLWGDQDGHQLMDKHRDRTAFLELKEAGLAKDSAVRQSGKTVGLVR